MIKTSPSIKIRLGIFIQKCVLGFLGWVCVFLNATLDQVMAQSAMENKPQLYNLQVAFLRTEFSSQSHLFRTKSCFLTQLVCLQS